MRRGGGEEGGEEEREEEGEERGEEGEEEKRQVEEGRRGGGRERREGEEGGRGNIVSYLNCFWSKSSRIFPPFPHPSEVLQRVRVDLAHLCHEAHPSEQNTVVLLVQKLACGGYKYLHQIRHLAYYTHCT